MRSIKTNRATANALAGLDRTDRLLDELPQDLAVLRPPAGAQLEESAVHVVPPACGGPAADAAGLADAVKGTPYWNWNCKRQSGIPYGWTPAYTAQHTARACGT